MIYMTGANCTNHRHALSGALALARLAGWQLVSGASLPPQLAHALHDPQAELVLVPWVEGEVVSGISDGLRFNGNAAVMVTPGVNRRREPTLFMSVAHWFRREICWHHQLRLWVDAYDAAWLVPDPEGKEPEGECFRLHRVPLQPSASPWPDQDERDFGFANADLQLSHMMARR
jgi:hypothetical protein